MNKKNQNQPLAPAMTNEQIEETGEKIMESMVEVDPETGEMHAKHYRKPEPDENNKLTKFDYSRLRGAKFDEYFELVEGKVKEQKSHAMAVRFMGGMNRNNSYFFDMYRGYAIKETTGDHTKVIGIELVSDKPKNVGLRLPLHVAITLNSQIGASNSAYPCNIYLLNQTQTL
jgi:hypothetical protein